MPPALSVSGSWQMSSPPAVAEVVRDDKGVPDPTAPDRVMSPVPAIKEKALPPSIVPPKEISPLFELELMVKTAAGEFSVVGTVPPTLKELTLAEEIVVSKVSPAAPAVIATSPRDHAEPMSPANEIVPSVVVNVTP